MEQRSLRSLVPVFRRTEVATVEETPLDSRVVEFDLGENLGTKRIRIFPDYVSPDGGNVMVSGAQVLVDSRGVKETYYYSAGVEGGRKFAAVQTDIGTNSYLDFRWRGGNWLERQLNRRGGHPQVSATLRKVFELAEHPEQLKELLGAPELPPALPEPQHPTTEIHPDPSLEALAREYEELGCQVSFKDGELVVRGRDPSEITSRIPQGQGLEFQVSDVNPSDQSVWPSEPTLEDFKAQYPDCQVAEENGGVWVVTGASPEQIKEIVNSFPEGSGYEIENREDLEEYLEQTAAM